MFPKKLCGKKIALRPIPISTCISFIYGFQTILSSYFVTRYIEYISDMAAAPPEKQEPNSSQPHNYHVSLSMIEMRPVPLFSRLRNGCRPFCEVYVGERRVLTTSKDYDLMK